MRRTKKIVRGLARLARRPQSRSPRPVSAPPQPENFAIDDPLANAPRIVVSPAVVADLAALSADGRPVVLSDGERELVVMLPVEQYRAQQVALARQRAEQGARQTVSAARSAVLDPDEVAALLSDWDHSQAPRPIGAPGHERSRPVRVSDPPRRRLNRR